MSPGSAVLPNPMSTMRMVSAPSSIQLQILVTVVWLRMRQTALYVGQARQEDRIVLVVMVSLEDEFVPVVNAQAVFQQFMQPVVLMPTS